MNKPSVSSVRWESPSGEGNSENGAGEMPSAVNRSDDTGSPTAARRLRNAIILANAVAWLIIAALVKWLFF